MHTTELEKLRRIVDVQEGRIDTLLRRYEDLNVRLIQVEVTLRQMLRIAHAPPPASIDRKARGEPYVSEETPSIQPAHLWGEA